MELSHQLLNPSKEEQRLLNIQSHQQLQHCDERCHLVLLVWTRCFSQMKHVVWLFCLHPLMWTPALLVLLRPFTRHKGWTALQESGEAGVDATRRPVQNDVVCGSVEVSSPIDG